MISAASTAIGPCPMIDDPVETMTTDLVAALARLAAAEELERDATLRLSEAEEALEDEPDDDRHRLARDRAEEVWRDVQAHLEEARQAREAIGDELRAMDPAAVQLAHLRYGRSAER